MIETDGVVTGRRGDRAWVEVGRKSTCGHCESSGSCGGSLFSGLFGGRAINMSVRNVLDANVGDRVILGLPERVMLAGSLRLYMVPLMGLFLGAGAAEYLATRLATNITEPWVILGGLLGLTAALWVQNRFSPQGENESSEVVMIRKVAAVFSVVPPTVAHHKE